jgi:hypothetical protein
MKYRENCNGGGAQRIKYQAYHGGAYHGGGEAQRQAWRHVVG